MKRRGKMKLLAITLLLVTILPAKLVSAISFESSNYCHLAVLKTNGDLFNYECQAGETVDEALLKFNFINEVKLAYPVQTYSMSLDANDPGYSYQKEYLDLIKAPVGWDKMGDFKLRPIIAVLDSGVDINNPDLQSNIWFNAWEVPGDKQDNDRNGFIDDQYGWDFANDSPDPLPKYEEGWTEVAMQHGTVVAGVAAAVGNNYQGVTGVAWQARIMALRVLNGKGSGDTVTVARAIKYAVANGADIINLSFVGEHSDPILKQVITDAYNAGVIIVAASGNELGVGVDLDLRPQYPVCDDGSNEDNHIIGVAAIGADSKLSDFSNYGSKCIDISAPGVKIFSTQFVDKNNTKFKEAYGGYWSGTSVAAPLVSGVLAILKSAYPKYRPTQLRDILIASGDLIDYLNPAQAGKLGRRLNLESAFKLADSFKVINKSPIVVAAASQFKPQVALLDVSGEQINSFTAYHPRFLGGVNVATGDLDGDGELEVVTAPKSGGGPHIRIFNQKGELKGQFMAFVDSFKGGLSLAIKDINKDGSDDIIVGTGAGAISLVRIFDGQGKLLNQFQAYDNNYISGINVSAGDLNNDGEVELAVTPQRGNLPMRIVNRFGDLKKEFALFPYSFRGGVNITIGDVNGDGSDEIIAVPGEGGGPQVRIFNMNGKVLSQFFAFNSKWRGGVNVSAGDVDADGKDDIVLTASSTGRPEIRVLDGTGKQKSSFNLNGGILGRNLTVAVYN